MSTEKENKENKNIEVYLSTHIQKLKEIRSFNLPAVKTCPGRTKACEKYCYARKGHFLFKSVQKRYENNYYLSQNRNFVDMMLKSLSSNERYIRIHSSGDFYSQSYFNKWVQIARRAKNIKFLAYTRNYDLDASKLPLNFKLIYTVDSETKKLNPTIERLAIVGEAKLSKIFKHNTKLRMLDKEFTVCNQKDCTRCLKCWNTDENILFPQQFSKYNVSNELNVIPLLPLLNEQNEEEELNEEDRYIIENLI